MDCARCIAGVSLREHLNDLPRGGVQQFAELVGITPTYLQQLAARLNGREASPELSVVIEQRTGGAVRRWNLRPTDWHLIWPELIDTDGAPPIPAKAKAEQEAV